MHKILLWFLLLMPTIAVCEDSRGLSDCAAITSDANRLACFDSYAKRTVASIKESSENSFRKTKWGMSRSEVKKTEEGEPARDDEEGLIYDVSISGIDGLALYRFSQGKLAKTRYFFTEDHINNNNHINDFDTLKSLLIEKYGKPQRDELIWRGDTFKDEPSRYGMAVVTGNLVYVASWQTEETKIQLVLSGEDFDARLSIDYTSIELEEMESKERTRKETDKL